MKAQLPDPPGIQKVPAVDDQGVIEHFLYFLHIDLFKISPLRDQDDPVTVLGNMERFAIFCFAPWIAEALLKAVSRFRAESYGLLSDDGTLEPRPGGVRSLTHLVMMMGRFKEWQVSLVLIAVETAICVSSLILML